MEWGDSIRTVSSTALLDRIRCVDGGFRPNNHDFGCNSSTTSLPVERRFTSISTNISTLGCSNHLAENEDDAEHEQEKFINSIPPVETVIANIDKAAQYNQGNGGGPNGPDKRYQRHNWNVAMVLDAVTAYEFYLRKLYHQHCADAQIVETKEYDDDYGVSNSRLIIDIPLNLQQLFVSPKVVTKAFTAVLRCKLPTRVLSHKIREWERLIGAIGKTSMSDELSFAMLEANGKAGNVGRVIKLLALRQARGYPPQTNEFVYAVTAIESAALSLRRNRNVFLSETNQPQIDDPTRWLDAILLNMHQREVMLTTKMANRMLNTYASTGKSGKATHFFYQIYQEPVILSDEAGNPNNKNSLRYDGMARQWNRPVKVKMRMRPPPPYHKVPSQIRGNLMRKPGTDVKHLKMGALSEGDSTGSPVLNSAISFADSLKQGACGHDPIELDLYSYSILMNTCVNRGSLWRAMHILDEVMPANGIKPDIVSYDILLIGLSRVGDVPTMREYFRQLIANGLHPSKETIKAIVDGLLNLGDVVSAVSVCQDTFNQYSVLPPYTTHLKILEFSLARGLVFEAKRHLAFIQQLWKWEPNQYHSEEFCLLMKLTQKNPHLSKEAMQKLFAYFGETLDESDFF